MASESRIRTNRLSSSDVPELIGLLQAYMQEGYQDSWHGSAEALRRDALGQQSTVHLATAADGQLLGFLAWTASYDLHHCVSGAEVMDLYVIPQWRGQGVALILGCAAAAEILRSGGRYMKGTVVEKGSAGQLYRRFGVCDASGCTVAGRALRRLAELAGRSAREIAQRLPERSWNYES